MLKHASSRWSLARHADPRIGLVARLAQILMISQGFLCLVELLTMLPVTRSSPATWAWTHRRKCRSPVSFSCEPAQTTR